MKWTIIGLLLSFNCLAKINLAKHPIYSQIIKNKPTINKKYAMRLSNVIYNATRKYHLPPRIFTAILMQESNYRLGATGCHWGLTLPQCSTLKLTSIKAKCKTNPELFRKEVRVCSDFGIGQIHYKNIEAHKLNTTMLLTDLKYSIEASAIVLRDFKKRYERKDIDWWVRYNCGTKGSTERDTCRIYKKLVSRYL